MPEFCATCRTPIVWAKTGKGRWMPVDAEPVTDGNLLLSHRQVGQPPVAVVQTPAQISGLAVEHDRSPQDGPLRLFVSHFARCPHADRHRRTGGVTA